jgi:hypothetical protein
LKGWGVTVDDAFFLGGIDKSTSSSRRTKSNLRHPDPKRHTTSRRTRAARNRAALPEPLRLQSPSGEAGVTFQPGHLQPRRRGDQPQLSEFNGA